MHNRWVELEPGVGVRVVGERTVHTGLVGTVMGVNPTKRLYRVLFTEGGLGIFYRGELEAVA